MTYHGHDESKLRRRARLTAALCGLVVLAGCVTSDPPPATPVDIGPLSTQIGSLAQANSDLRVANERAALANEALRSENERLKAMLRADSDAGISANAKGWLPFERHVWRHQLDLLPGVQPDASTAAKWTEAAGLYAAGGSSAMQGVIDSLHSDAAVQASKIGELLSKTEQLERERDEAQGVAMLAQKAVEDAKAALAAAIKQARQDEADKLRRAAIEFRVKVANLAGATAGGLSLVCVAALFFVPALRGKLLRGAAAGAVASILAFSFAEWSTLSWFLPVFAGIICVILASWGGWEFRLSLKSEAEKAKADRDGLVASVLVQKLNDFYDASDEATKAKLDDGLFAKLAVAGPAYAAAVKRIKADCIEAAAATSSSAPQASTQSPNRRAT